MDTGVNVSDVGTLAGLTGLGGYGYGGRGNFAGDGSAVKEGIRGNRDIQLLDSVNRGTSSQFLGNQIDRGHTAISDRVADSQNFLANKITDQGSEFRFANITSQHASIERQMNANKADIDRQMISNQQLLTAQLHAQDLKQTECCCELKAGQAAINAKLDLASVSNGKDAEIQRLNFQLMLANGNSGPGNSGHGQGNG